MVTSQQERTLWNPADIQPGFQNTPLFFQCIVGAQPLTEEQCQHIRDTIVAQECVSCSDGAFYPDTGIGSQSWVFNGSQDEVVSGVGPTDGHPSLMSSYIEQNYAVY